MKIIRIEKARTTLESLGEFAQQSTTIFVTTQCKHLEKFYIRQDDKFICLESDAFSKHRHRLWRRLLKTFLQACTCYKFLDFTGKLMDFTRKILKITVKHPLEKNG